MGADNVLQTGSQLITNFTTEKIFIGGNQFETGNFVSDSDCSPGLVVGRIGVSGNLVPLVSTAEDGSQYPVGILAQSVQAEDERQVTICVGGDVDESLVSFIDSEDNLDTVVDSRRLRDRIKGDTLGILLVSMDELSNFDNY